MIDRVIEILSVAEKSLVGLSGNFAESRNYDGATLVLGIAREISSLAKKWSDTSELQSASAGKPSVPRFETEGDVARGPLSTVTRRRGKKSGYPKFFRHDDWLIKVGYSRSEGEYEHKCPKSVLNLLTEVLTKAGANGAMFSMSDVLPLTNADGSEVPSYQVYLCLNWLRDSELVQEHGRRGYSILKSTNLQVSVQARWGQLPPSSRS
jgi:hypothetical protein